MTIHVCLRFYYANWRVVEISFHMFSCLSTADVAQGSHFICFDHHQEQNNSLGNCCTSLKKKGLITNCQRCRPAQGAFCLLSPAGIDLTKADWRLRCIESISYTNTQLLSAKDAANLDKQTAQWIYKLIVFLPSMGSQGSQHHRRWHLRTDWC